MTRMDVEVKKGRSWKESQDSELEGRMELRFKVNEREAKAM